MHYCQYMTRMQDDCHAVSQQYDDRCCGRVAHFVYDGGWDDIQFWVCAEHYDVLTAIGKD